MKRAIYVGLFAILLAPATAGAQAPKSLGTEEFGMTPRELVQAIEKKGGKNVYVIEIQSPEHGEKDVFVDIETGKIVGTD